ncbi:hypothetical protein BPOR_0383g00030 [Botrytis porri]|uniref:Uncharacterized protein n=1 Tax=Botrytis porri TaxID=87229 RepID=A0A4Z1KHM1_9HELO|nr:hypothetical protein BPOR_0383g00030 [Botrytis porri]
MKGIVEKKSPKDTGETRNISETKRREISRYIPREASLHLIDLSLDIINLITESLPPSSIVLFGLTCHISETSLTAPIWRPDTDSRQSDASETDAGLQLHHILKNWNYIIPSPFAKQMKWMDDDIFSVIRAAMSIMTMVKDAKRLNEEVEFGALTKGQRRIRNSTKLAGGLFFKCPQPGGRRKYSWRRLSEDERFELTDLMQLWAPRVDSLEYELDLHRRLRRSQYMMTSYAVGRN